MMKKRSLKFKIMIASVAGILLTVTSLLCAIIIQKDTLATTVNRELDILAKSETAKLAKDVYLLCRAQNEAVQQKVDCDLNVAREIVEREGGVSFGKKELQWNAVNQYTKAVNEVALPEMLVGKTSLGQIVDMNTPSPIVDQVKELVGGTCTIFQRMNQAGDVLRVCTNVEKLDGTRAVGTYIPAVNPDGTPNPVVSTVMRGETYRGRAYVVNAWYITAYEPIFDKNDKVVGVLYVGVKEENVESLRKGVMDIVVGKTGYVYVLGGKGDQKGRYIISKGGQRDGENIWEAKDADGNFFIQSIVNDAVDTSDGSVIFKRYPWKNKGEDEARWKIAAVTYFEPWDWVIGAGAYEDDFMDARLRVGESLQNMILITCIIGLVLFLIFGGIALILWLQKREEVGRTRGWKAAWIKARRDVYEYFEDLRRKAPAVRSRCPPLRLPP